MILAVGTASATRGSAPVGHYLADEVGQLAGVSGYTVGQWARREYIRASQQAHGYPYVYAYQDIGEAMVVHALIEQGVGLRYIKRALRALRERVGSTWPLTKAEIYVPRMTPEQKRKTHGRGRTVAVKQGEEVYDLVRNHAVLPESDLISIAADLRRGGWAARQMKDLQYIEVDPERLSGRPTIKGRRIAAEMVAEIAQGVNGFAVLREDYDLLDPEIKDAVRWWKLVSTYREAA
jgi:uncharacterized protein (DUF433 family)